MSMRNGERMTGRDGIAVADGKSQGVRCDDSASVRRTKGAFERHAAFYPYPGEERGPGCRLAQFPLNVGRPACHYRSTVTQREKGLLKRDGKLLSACQNVRTGPG